MDKEQLSLKDQLAFDILKAMLINKMPHTHTDMIEWDCKTAYKYAESFLKVCEEAKT